MTQKASRYCGQCGKALKACICPLISQIDNDIPLIVLQHPSEVKQPLGTARILSLSLPGCEVIVGEDFTDNAQLNTLLNGDTDYAVLYPGENALPISSWAKERTKTQGLILLDGTWRKAFKMWQLSKNLHALPCVSLEGIAQGNYRIRKSPKAEGLSTVEAGFYALATMSGEAKHYMPLLDAFNGMIDFQIQQMPPGVYERHYGPNSQGKDD